MNRAIIWTRSAEKVHEPFFRAFTCFGRGMKYNRQRNHKKAIHELEKVKIDTLDAHDRLLFHTVLAECCLKLGEYGKAADNYHKALNLAPDDNGLQALIEQCHLMKKEFQLSMKLSAEEMQNFQPVTPCVTEGQSQVHRVVLKKGTFKFGHNEWRLVASAAITIIITTFSFQQFTGKDGLKDSERKRNVVNSEVLKTSMVTVNRQTAPTPRADDMVTDTAVTVSSKTGKKSNSTMRRHNAGNIDGHYKSIKKVNYAAVHPTDTIHFE